MSPTGPAFIPASESTENDQVYTVIQTLRNARQASDTFMRISIKFSVKKVPLKLIRSSLVGDLFFFPFVPVYHPATTEVFRIQIH